MTLKLRDLEGLGHNVGRRLEEISQVFPPYQAHRAERRLAQLGLHRWASKSEPISCRGSAALPTTPNGRVCGAIPAMAPSVMTISAFVERATSISESANVLQRRCGSTPDRRTRSWFSFGHVAPQIEFVGQTISRSPLLSLTTGLSSWKLKNISGSMCAKGFASYESIKRSTECVAALQHQINLQER